MNMMMMKTEDNDDEDGEEEGKGETRRVLRGTRMMSVGMTNFGMKDLKTTQNRRVKR